MVFDGVCFAFCLAVKPSDILIKTFTFFYFTDPELFRLVYALCLIGVLSTCVQIYCLNKFYIFLLNSYRWL